MTGDIVYFILGGKEPNRKQKGMFLLVGIFFVINPSNRYILQKISTEKFLLLTIEKLYLIKSLLPVSYTYSKWFQN